MAQRLMDHCVDAIASLKKHQNQCAALAAELIERLHSGVSLEGGILAFDRWQLQNSLSGMQAELAMVMQIPEGSAGRLMEHATALVRELPTTMDRLRQGELGWEHAVVIAEETALVQSSGAPSQDLEGFELQLLGKAKGSTLTSFREKSRRLRERLFPESIVPRSRRAYADRQMTKGRARDGMSWLGLYAPAPTIEGIWDQCTATAQAAQGPHEERTLTQLRADIAAALLLNQSLAENQIFAPVPDHSPAADVPAPGGESTPPNTPCGAAAAPPLNPAAEGYETRTDPNGRPFQPRVGSGGRVPLSDPTGLDMQHLAHVPTKSGHAAAPPFLPVEPPPLPGEASCNDIPEPSSCDPGLVPVFDDPDYSDPEAFSEPDIRNTPEWIPNARPPVLTTRPEPSGGRQSCPESAADATAGSCQPSPWPPLPTVMPIVLVPALSMLGATDGPAWMEGAGPISMEVAKRLTSNAPSLYRLLVDPVTGSPLDIAPERYRVSKAMRTALRIRDEYCQFPGCMAKACNAQIDHIRSFDGGGSTTRDNMEVLCLHHHLLKHFKDDRTRCGELRMDQGPERQRVSLRGWVPHMTESGRVSWTSPTGRFYPADIGDIRLPLYPEWLRCMINDSLSHNETGSRSASDNGAPSPDEHRALIEADWDPADLPAYEPAFDPGDAYDPGETLEMPAAFVLEDAEEAQLYAATVEHALAFPDLGLAA